MRLFEPRRVGPFIAESLRHLDVELDATIPRVLGHTDSEALHAMRVAIRRLRTVLKISRSVFGRFHVEAVRDAFRHVHRSTGALRDEEVLAETLAELEVNDRAFKEWCSRRKARERKLRREVIAIVESGELTKARALLAALLALPVKPSRDKDLLKFARATVVRAQHQVEDKHEIDTDDVLALHELRIAFKHLRYSCEIFTDALPPELSLLVKTAARFQKRLGEVHDTDVASLTIAQVRGLPVATREKATRLLGVRRDAQVSKWLRDRAELEASMMRPQAEQAMPQDRGEAPRAVAVDAIEEKEPVRARKRAPRAPAATIPAAPSRSGKSRGVGSPRR